MGKLTKRAVDAFTPPDQGQAFLWNRELRGFGVRAIPSGLKTFVLQYRNAEGRSRRIVVGRYWVLTVEQARDQAKIKLGAVAGGTDPAEANGSSREAITVAELCDWYLAEAEAGRILGRRNRPIKASTLAMDRSRIEMHIKPLLGRRQVRALKLADIEGMQSDIAAGKTAKPRGIGRGGTTTGGGGVAARTVSTLQSLFAHATRFDVIAFNPAEGVRKLAGTAPHLWQRGRRTWLFRVDDRRAPRPLRQGCHPGLHSYRRGTRTCRDPDMRGNSLSVERGSE